MDLEAILNKQPHESWREAVARTAGKFGMTVEVLEQFDEAIKHGCHEVIAARDALYEWDCLEF